MKKIVTIIVLSLIITLGNVYAADPTAYYVVIDKDNNIVVRKDASDGAIVTNYSNVFTYSGGVLTVKENQFIKSLHYHNSLTITSNDKPVMIGNIYSADPSTPYDIPVSSTLTITHLNTKNSSYKFSTDYMKKVIVRDSHIGYHRLTTNLYDDIDAGVYIYDSEVYAERTDTEIHPYGDLVIKNSKIKTGYINNESQSIYIDDSDIQINGGLYTEEDACIKINNSSVIGTSEYAYIDVQLGPDHSEGLIINNSTIDVHQINFSGYSAVGGKVEIRKSNIKSDILSSARDIFIYDSFVNTKRLQADNYDKSKTLIENSTVNIGTDYVNTRYLTINNSYVTAKCRITSYNDVLIKNSYFNLTAPDSDVSFFPQSGLTITNSNFYVETKNTPVSYMGELNKDSDVEWLDKANTSLKTVQSPSSSEFKVFAYGDGSYSKSVKLVSLATVTFKLENGTWQDGTTEDKVIRVPVWTSLKESDIPKVKAGTKWKPTVEVGTVITKNTVYLNGVEVAPKLDTNPNTGVNNYIIEFIGIAIVGIIVYLVMNTKKKFRSM